MHHYPHHIGDFNSATMHLTRTERSVYREALDMYYDTEQPLPGGDFDRLAKRLRCPSEEEKAALRDVLAEFFSAEGEGDARVYRHARCDEEIRKYCEQLQRASKAGSASAAKRLRGGSTGDAVALPAATTSVEQEGNGRSTDVQQPFNERSTNQEPRTNNQSALIVREAPDPPEAVDKSGEEGSTLAVVWRELAGYPPGLLGANVLAALAEEGCAAAHLRVAWAVARERKLLPDRISVAYVAPIVRDARDGKLAVQRAQRGAAPASATQAWQHDDNALVAKGGELGLSARPGESYPQFRARVGAEIEKRMVAA